MRWRMFPGAVKYLQQRHDLTKWQMRGASAGALVACLAACNVDPQEAYEAADRYVSGQTAHSASAMFVTPNEQTWLDVSEALNNLQAV